MKKYVIAIYLLALLSLIVMAKATSHDDDPVADFLGNVIRDKFFPGLLDEQGVKTVCVQNGDAFEIYVVADGKVESKFEANHC